MQLLVEPPVNLLAMLGLGLVLLLRPPSARWRRTGGWLAGLAFLALVVLSLPVVARGLLIGLEIPLPRPLPQAQAIVILSADGLRARTGGITGPPDLGPLTLQRLRAGAVLHRLTGLPVLVTGGVLRPGEPPIAIVMARVLDEELGIKARWVENGSATTWENAALSTPMLAADGIRTAFIVTHAWHLRRSLLAFRHFGLVGIPAPSHLTGPETIDAGAFVPRAGAWADSNNALHEWIGLAWYALRARG